MKEVFRRIIARCELNDRPYSGEAWGAVMALSEEGGIGIPVEEVVAAF